MSPRAEGLQTRVAVGPYIIRTHKTEALPGPRRVRLRAQNAGVAAKLHESNKPKESNATRACTPLRIEESSNCNKLNPDKVNPPTAKIRTRAPEPEARTPEPMTQGRGAPRLGLIAAALG